MKKINIYVTQEQKKLLNILKNTHRVSFSTITDKITFTYYVNPYTRQLMCIDTKIKQPGQKYKKTSVNLKNEYDLTEKQINNALQIYFLKMDKDPNDKEFYGKIRNNINHALQDAYDPWYNYNEFCHMKERFEKENQQ